MSQKLPLNGFKWVEDLSEFDEDIFFEDDVQYPKMLHELHNDLPFLLRK